MSAYIKRHSDGKIICSCSSQSAAKDLSVLQNFLTSRGYALADYTIANGTEEEIVALITSTTTLMEKWLSDIRASDSMLPRWGEDILDRDGIEDLPQALIDKYNAKKTLRSEKPA